MLANLVATNNKVIEKDMLGKKSSEYKQYIKYKNYYRNLTCGLDVVSLGSTMSYFDYDFGYWKKNGACFASIPQTLTYDYTILKQYSNQLNQGCFILINLAEFTFLVDRYKNDKANHKYYFF